MKTNQDILFIAYYFPPIKAIGVFRSYYLATHMPPFFCNIHVITTTNQKYLPKELLPVEQLNVKTAYTFDYRTLMAFRKKQAMQLSENDKKSLFYKTIMKFTNSFPFNLLWGDGGFLYIIHAFFIASRLVKKHNITTVYSSYSPYSDHFVAFLLKKRFPKLIWIADFRDLHVEPLYDYVYWKPFQHWCNRQILKKANLVTTVSGGLAKHLKSYHTNVYAFKNGIPPVQRNAVPVSEQQRNSVPLPFTIAYTGSMFGDERNPTLFLEVVKHLVDILIFTKNNFKIVYAGKDAAVWNTWIEKYGLQDFFISKGMVSLSEAHMIQQNSHINLLLTSATKDWTGVFTGKIFEYLAAQRPVLVLINGAQDVEYEYFISDLNAGFVGYNDRSFQTMKAFILEKFEEWQSTGAVHSTLNQDKLKEMGWEYVAEKLMDTIKGSD